MGKKLLLGAFAPATILLQVFFSTPAMALASTSSGSVAAQSASLIDKSRDPYSNDKRVITLYDFLGLYHSPLQEYADVFVRTADKYDLDWRLVAAISGVESTFAKEMPSSSYNAWGWGIYGNNMIYFQSYQDAIETISKSLRENYINKWGSKNVHQIGRFYASSPTWSQRVVFFMNKIDNQGQGDLAINLPITL